MRSRGGVQAAAAGGALGAPAAPDAGSDADMAGAQDTIYLCNFRVSVDGEWLCLKELQDMDMPDSCGQQRGDEAVTSPGDPMHSLMAREPVVIERSNLVNILKLIVKELIEQSLRYGRMLDSDHLPLRHFFIVLEHVMRHGLKPKKGLLGPKKELWDILQMVEKYAPEAQDITASVRDLPTVRTAMGRARAWLRLALMQKRLADYLRVLLEHREDTLEEYLEPHALMLNEEAVLVTGLLVGLNVVDCNLCVKEEDLDSQQGVIDFSLYLRGGSSTAEPAVGASEPKQRHITTMLDQKNYIEELNRHLNATVANLQAKVESLTTTNALMKEDLAIAKNGMIQLVEENNQLKYALGQDINKDNRLRITEVHSDDEEKHSVKSSSESEKPKSERESELVKMLEEERNRSLELQKELDLQMCLKAEMEVAMKLLEKDIHDKQDTVVSLRRQLDDIKLINLEMYKKLQECESSLKHKKELITKLEAKTESMGSTIHQLDEKLQEEQARRKSDEESARSLGQKAAAAETRAAGAEGDLRIEREWRISLQDSMMKDREKISLMAQEIDSLKVIGQRYVALQEEQHTLRSQYGEAQRTLEEVGATLSENKLRLAELMEGGGGAAGPGGADEAAWASDRDTANCTACAKEFNLTRRKHHCRRCSHIFCKSCSERSVALAGGSRPVRVCDACSTNLYPIDVQCSLLLPQHHCRRCGHIFCNSCSERSVALAGGSRPVRVCDACSTNLYPIDVQCSLLLPQHHCRRCGHIFCNSCSERSVALAGGSRPVRVCDACSTNLYPIDVQCSLLLPQHHCRRCGHIFCNSCSERSVALAGGSRPVRVCDACSTNLYPIDVQCSLLLPQHHCRRCGHIFCNSCSERSVALAGGSRPVRVCDACSTNLYPIDVQCSLLLPQHHCRRCGHIFCNSCSERSVALAGGSRPVRVCDACSTNLYPIDVQCSLLLPQHHCRRCGHIFCNSCSERSVALAGGSRPVRVCDACSTNLYPIDVQCSLLLPQHHCRRCGHIFCNSCSERSVALAGGSRPVRVCDACSTNLYPIDVQCSLLLPQHHCRRCGHIFCNSCSERSVALAGGSRPVRVCDACSTNLYPIDVQCSLLLPQHHCRRCGHIFCNSCSERSVALAGGSRPVRVCDACSTNLYPIDVQCSLLLPQHHCRRCGHIFCNSCSERSVALAGGSRPVRVCDACSTNLYPIDVQCSLLLPQHHCRRCGHIFCNSCSERSVALAGGSRPVRVCDACYTEVRLA